MTLNLSAARTRKHSPYSAGGAVADVGGVPSLRITPAASPPACGVGAPRLQKISGPRTLGVLLSCGIGLATGFSAAVERPNIVFILADDLGIMDINAYAARFSGEAPAKMFYETPHLDRLVREGTSFSQAYACQLCSPTRAGIITGRNAARIGVNTATPGAVKTFYNQGLPPPDGYLAQDAVFWGDTLKLQQALLNGGTMVALPSGQPADAGRDEVTLAEALTGYRSAFIGKWHLGGHGSKGWQPRDQGFEELAYYDDGGSPYFRWRDTWNSRKKQFPKMAQEELVRGKAGPEFGPSYLTDDLTEVAVRYLRERERGQGGPFFLYLCHFAVHTPFQAKPEDIAYFEKKATRGWNGQANAVYAAMLKSLDDSVGRILTALKETGLESNTVLGFMSDNGGVMYTNPVATNNAPFKGGKALHYEGGIRVPMVFRWPGYVPANAWCTVPVSYEDIFPTLLDLAKLDPKAGHRANPIDGRSLVPLFGDPTNAKRGYARDTFYWHYPFNVIVKNPLDGLPSAPSSAIRVGDFKLIFDWSGALRLYNIARDPYENEELSAAQPERALALFRQLNDWLDANAGAKYLPALNPDYDPAREARARPFVDLRKMYLGEARAIRSAVSDPRFRLTPPVKP